VKRTDVIRGLFQAVASEMTKARVEETLFDAGGASLFVRWGARSFEIVWLPKSGFGLSENFPGTLPFTGHDHAVATLGDAISQVRAWARAEPQVAPLPQVSDQH
jgi:hypothetical protein